MRHRKKHARAVRETPINYRVRPYSCTTGERIAAATSAAGLGEGHTGHSCDMGIAVDLAAMRAIRSYVTGLHQLADNYELAYTLLVVSIEALEQEFDDFQPIWQDYDQRKRLAMDKALAGADEQLATRVRETLLETEHCALSRRFREFAVDHLRPSYFRAEAHGLANPAERADLDSALRQAYNLRSRYIHELRELPKILTLPVPGDTVEVPFGHEVLLTFQGLSRLARHVITTFIRRQPKVDREEYDYSQERAGILQMQMAPQYWIGDVADLDRDSGRERLEGFLKQVSRVNYICRCCCCCSTPGSRS